MSLSNKYSPANTPSNKQIILLTKLQLALAFYTLSVINIDFHLHASVFVIHVVSWLHVWTRVIFRSLH